MLLVGFFGNLKKFTMLNLALFKIMEKVVCEKFKVNLTRFLYLAGRHVCYYVLLAFTKITITKCRKK